MNRLLLFFALCLFFLVTPVAQAQDDDLPLVVVTTTIIADVTRNIAGDRVEIVSLMPPNADVHGFNPTPRDLIPLEEADLVLINGADLEETMIEMVRTISLIEPVVVSDGITVLAYGIDRGSGNLALTPRRILLGDTEGNVHILNVFSNEIIASYPFSHPITLYAERARHARYGFVVSPESVHVIDSGFRMVQHFDHYDPYLVNPQLIDFTLSSIEIDTARLVDAAFDLDDSQITLNDTGDPVILSIPDAFDSAIHPVIGDPLMHPNSDNQLLLLTVNGELLSVDTATGMIRQALPVLPGPLETAPVMIASGDMVYIADPAGSTLLEVYAGENELVLTDQLDFGFTITSMAAFGAVVDPHALDTTSQVTGRVLGAGVDCSIQGDAVHGPCDAHFWLDPNNVVVWADNIAAALAEIDPDNADFYRANAATYKEQLRVLDAEVEAILEVIPLENRRLVTNHDFLGYFARRYGFEIVGVVLPGGSTLAEPSSRDLAELIEIIEREGIQTIIVEASNVNRISDTLAEQVGIETILLYSDSLSDADGPTPTYIDYMRYNAQAIAAVLGETP
ncbi:zinc ABC transporter solute-binding protein [bacterium]|nr:zinc ABC transporter solute-binding protein [bacterium]